MHYVQLSTRMLVLVILFWSTYPDQHVLKDILNNNKLYIKIFLVSIDVKDVEDLPQTFPDLEQRLQVNITASVTNFYL